MKILAVSDIHGDMDLLEELKQRAKEVDLVLYAGDVVNAPDTSENKLRDLEEFIKTLDEIDVPVRFVRGNCDDFNGGLPYHLVESEEFGEITVTPFEDILTTPFGTYREVDEEQITEDLGNISGDIILAHQPPFGVGDDIGGGVHVGSHAVREWIEKNRPKYWICGHVHEGFGEYELGDTKVINVAKKMVVFEV